MDHLPPKLSRRHFIAGSGMLASALCLNFSLATPLPQGASRKQDRSVRPEAWVRIGADEQITFIIGKQELGQGVATSNAMILAEEMDAAWDNVRFQLPDARPDYENNWGKQTTGASSSAHEAWNQLRKVGATIRHMLRQAAANTWGVDVGECTTEEGKVIHPNSGRSVTYGALGAAAMTVPVPTQVKLKTRDQWRIIGKALPRLDAQEKVSGKAVYGWDLKLPGMLVASVTPQMVTGAQPISYNKSGAQKVAGVKKVIEFQIRQKKFLAVVAQHTWAAFQGMEALKVTWGPKVKKINDAAIDLFLRQHLKKKGGQPRRRGNPEKSYADAPKKKSAVYQTRYLAHMPMEPICIVAWMHDGLCEIWAPMQQVSFSIDGASRASGLSKDKIRFHNAYVGGAFGLRLNTRVVNLAVTIAKAMDGTPIKMVFNRTDDLWGGHFHPATHTELKGALGPDNKIVSWTQRVAAIANPSPVIWEGLGENFYEATNQHTEVIGWRGAAPPGFPRTGPYRSVGRLHNVFARECFVDELAEEAGMDPVAFRAAHLKDARLAGVLKAVAEKSGWGKQMPDGEALGVAIVAAQLWGVRGVYSYAAAVSHVQVTSQGFRVIKVTIAADCGTVIHPGNVIGQMEGSVPWALTAVLKPGVRIKDGLVEQTNFGDYEVLRGSEMPKVDVVLIPSEEVPCGAGEIAVPIIMAATCNGASRVLGKRLRSVPLNLPAT